MTIQAFVGKQGSKDTMLFTEEDVVKVGLLAQPAAEYFKGASQAQCEMLVYGLCTISPSVDRNRSLSMHIPWGPLALWRSEYFEAAERLAQHYWDMKQAHREQRKKAYKAFLAEQKALQAEQ